MQPRGRRIPADRSISLIDDGKSVTSDILDVSASGIRLKLGAGSGVQQGQDVVLSNGLRSVPGTVRWCRGSEAGIAFLDRVSASDLQALTGVTVASGGGRWSPY